MGIRTMTLDEFEEHCRSMRAKYGDTNDYQLLLDLCWFIIEMEIAVTTGKSERRNE